MPTALHPAQPPPDLDASTRLFAVYGFPVRHSASPAMHNAAFRSLGIPACYLAFELAPTQLESALRGAAVMGFAGINLTVPHKLFAPSMMDDLDASVQEWGAVNTVVFERKVESRWIPLLQSPAGALGPIRLKGFNTDADGFMRALREEFSLETLSGKRILLLGAGGAGRVVALRMARDQPAELWLQNRTQEKAQGVADEIVRRHPGVKVHVGYPVGPVDLVVNATSLGLKSGDPSPFDAGRFSLQSASLCYDMIYRPSLTDFLREARASGCRAANGLGMLLHQGAMAFELWTGQTAPLDIMREALHRQIYGGQPNV